MSNDPSSSVEPRQRALDRALTCFSERAWADAYEAYGRADAQAPLGTEDLERMLPAAAIS